MPALLLNSAMAGGVLLIAVGFSLAFCRLVMRTGIVDAPDGVRKQQDQPVPRLGGIAILATLLLLGPVIAISLASAPLAIPETRLLFIVLGFTLFANVIGLWDDVATLPTSLKLLLLLGACLTASALGLQPPVVATPFGQTALPLILVVGSAAWLLVFTNAVNFMDGSNGMAVGCMTIMFAGLALASLEHGALPLSLGWFALIGACLGFLLLNVRGLIYSGDAGALGLGSLFAGLSLISGLEIWTIATLALPFLTDVLMTLIWRARHGKPWLEPHLDHAYQRLIAGGWTHMETAILYWGLTASSAVAATIAARGGGALPFAMFCALLIAGIALWLAHRRMQTS